MTSKLKIQVKIKPKTKYKMIDLFAGTGAFSYAFESTNRFETLFANDYDENSKKIYDLNFHTPLTLKDLNDLKATEIPSHDLLCGGFPCQPFSIAGQQKGFGDVRSNVFWTILDILKHHQPRIIVLENVKNLTSHDNGQTFATITKKLMETGYYLNYQVLNTCQITNIPQNRERIYIIGFRNRSDYDRFSFDFPPQKNDTIATFLETNVDQKYYYDQRFKVWDIIEKNVTKDISTNTIYQIRRCYIRENKSKVCPTLTANCGTGGHNVPILKDQQGIRKLTPRECFNLQGFPSNYQLPLISDSGLYKLAGNAVSVPVVKLIADKIAQLFS